MNGRNGGKYGRFKSISTLKKYLQYLIRKLMREALENTQHPNARISNILPLSVTKLRHLYLNNFTHFNPQISEDFIVDRINKFARDAHAELEKWFDARGGTVGGRDGKGFSHRWGYHIIQFEREDGDHSDNKLLSIAKEALHKVLNDPEDRPMIAVLHRDSNRPHVHIIYSLLGNRGKYLGKRIDYKKMANVCFHMEREFDLAPHNPKGDNVIPGPAFIYAKRRAGQKFESWKENLQMIVFQGLQAYQNDALGFFRHLFKSDVQMCIRRHEKGRIGLIFSIKFQGKWKFASASKLIKKFNLETLSKWLGIAPQALDVIQKSLLRRPLGQKKAQSLSCLKAFCCLLRDLGPECFRSDLYKRVRRLRDCQGLSSNQLLKDKLDELGLDLRLAVSHSTVKLSFRLRDDPDGIWLKFPKTVNVKQLGIICGVAQHLLLRWEDKVRYHILEKNQGAFINIVPLPIPRLKAGNPDNRLNTKKSPYKKAQGNEFGC